MKSTERQKFEDNWKEAFEGSEMTPSDSVWSNIDLKLDNEKMKRRVVYYQRLAAASILFALLIGVGGVRYFDSSTNESLVMKSNADTKNKSEASSADQQASPDKSMAEIKTGTESNTSIISNKQSTGSELLQSKQSNEINNSSVKSTATLQNGQINSTRISIASNTEILKQYIDNSLMDTKKYLPLASQPFENLSSYNSPPNLNNQLPEVAEVNKEEKKAESETVASVLTTDPSDENSSEKKKKKTEELWLAFGAAAGSYNPGNSAASSVQAQSSSLGTSNYGFVNQAAPQSTRSSVGSAYSIGLSVGKKIADRWIIQTGVNYLSQAIDYTSNFTTQSMGNESKAALADYAELAPANSQTLTQPYKVNSSMEFVSVPVQAGYIIIDRKIGLQLNAGIASDIFLRNTLRDESGHSNKYSQSSGSESPYRSFNWAGLASTELSYKMFKQYRISIQPGFRYSLQPSLKSESGANSNPLVLDVGFRFRYIFQ